MKKPKNANSNFLGLGCGVVKPCHTGQTCLSSMLDIQRISWAKKEVQEDMSYAIIRNDKLTRVDAQGSYIHNDRRSKGHSN